MTPQYRSYRAISRNSMPNSLHKNAQKRPTALAARRANASVRLLCLIAKTCAPARPRSGHVRCNIPPKTHKWVRSCLTSTIRRLLKSDWTGFPARGHRLFVPQEAHADLKPARPTPTIRRPAQKPTRQGQLQPSAGHDGFNSQNLRAAPAHPSVQLPYFKIHRAMPKPKSGKITKSVPPASRALCPAHSYRQEQRSKPCPLLRLGPDSNRVRSRNRRAPKSARPPKLRIGFNSQKNRRPAPTASIRPRHSHNT